MKRRTALVLLAVGAVALAGCGQQGARVVGAAPVAAVPTTPATTTVTTAPTGPLVSTGRPAQGTVQLRMPVGVSGAYQYVNRTRNDCAQAAVATALTTTGRWARPDGGGTDRQAALMSTSAPDVLGGVWGSSPKLVRAMLGGSTTVKGTTGLEQALRAGHPVVVMLDLGPLGRGRGAHWTVVVGMDAEHVQVTNLGGGLVRRDAFEKALGGLVPTVAGVARTGLVPV